VSEAVAEAGRLVAAGRDIDLGLGQINVRNLRALGMSVEDAFDPCRNLQAAGRVLADGYWRGVTRAGPGQPALRIALSLYNTGHLRRGFANGYVARVSAAAGRSRSAPPSTAPVAEAPPPAWDSFAVARRAWAGSAFVFSPAGATP
jgi:type IV secretion system protein VirB1